MTPLNLLNTWRTRLRILPCQAKTLHATCQPNAAMLYFSLNNPMFSPLGGESSYVSDAAAICRYIFTNLVNIHMSAKLLTHLRTSVHTRTSVCKLESHTERFVSSWMTRRCFPILSAQNITLFPRKLGTTSHENEVAHVDPHSWQWQRYLWSFL